MSGQINLYHERYRSKREWLTLANVAGVALALLTGLLIAGTLSGRQAAQRGSEAAASAAQLNAAQTQMAAQLKAVAESKPSPEVAAEVAALEVRLAGRERIATLLEGGVVGTTAGFSDYLRGFGRQAQEGLWLTGFTIGSGGNDMEIRGRMLVGSALPDYIRRLGTEKAFQGRSFAALTVSRPESVPPPVAAPGAAAAPVAQRFVEFVLTPRLETPGGKS